MSEAIEIPVADIVKGAEKKPAKPKRPKEAAPKIPPLPTKKEEPKFDFSVKAASKRKPRTGALFTFLVFVALPVLASIAYYAGFASDQYRSEALFTVRGT